MAKISKKELFKKAAFHESGHVILSYLVRFKTIEVEIFEDDPGSGLSKFEFSKDFRITLLITSMQNYINDSSLYTNLDSNIKAVSTKIAYKITSVLLAGSLSEAINKAGIEFKGQLVYELSGPDLIRINNINECLTNETSNHSPNYISNVSAEVVELLRVPEIWNAVKHLSETILNSSNKKLNGKEIENSLIQIDFFNFINNL